MRILVAPDKFKGSLGASEAGEQIATGLRDVMPEAQIECAPVADGGEGTAQIICDSAGGEWVICEAHDATGRAIETRYAWLRERATAVIEMNEAAGISQIASDERDLLHATTFGVGEMIFDATKRDVREIIVGLGGSGTNDGGFGMARALGFRFFAGEQELRNGPAELVKLTRIVPNVEALAAASALHRIIAAADVTNPLLGAHGATQIFGPQKGASRAELNALEDALRQLAEVVRRDFGCDFREAAGAGAAGGLGFGLASFCGAELRAGFDVVTDVIHLDERIKNSDIVITGEGRLDAQTLEGKAPAGVARLARNFGKRVFAIVGSASDEPEVQALFDGVFSLVRVPVTVEEAIKNARPLLRQRGVELARLLSL